MTMMARLEEALTGGARQVDAMLAKVEFPHVEGRNVTFVYRGEAQEVTLQHWIHGLPGSLPFRRLRHSDLWVLQIDLPFRCVVSGGRSGGLPPDVDGEGMVASALRDLGGEIVDIQ